MREARLAYEVLASHAGSRSAHPAVHGRGAPHPLSLAARGAPLWGDAKYGGSGEGDIALFSCALAFPHPLTGEMLTFAKKPPAAYPWTEFPGEVL